MLARLIHISDTHFGGKFLNDTRLWHWVDEHPLPIVQGRYPHDYAVARLLDIAPHDIIEATSGDVPLAVIHTGDHTRSGRPSQFRVSDAFLTQGINIEESVVGLRLPLWRPGDCDSDRVLLEIPGNHDTWKGQYPNRDWPDCCTLRRGAPAVYVYLVDSNQSEDRTHTI